MALFENGTLTTPIGSEVQVETLPEIHPPRGFAESDVDWNIRVALWEARTRVIVITHENEDNELMGRRFKTAPLAFNATPAQIEAALLAATSVVDDEPNPMVAGDIEVTGSGRKFTYAFSGDFANTNIRPMFSAYNFRNQVVRETIDATGGTRTLSFKGDTTTDLAFNADAATIQAALEALDTVGAGEITVTADGADFVYTYSGTLSGTQPRISVDGANLTGGTSEISVSVEGDDGIKNYFETIQEGVSIAGQIAVKRAITERALGITDASFRNETKEPSYDIGDPRRYNADGSPKRDRR